MTLLSHAIVEGDRGASRTMAFLHGILGSSSNWRSFAKRLIAEKPGWRALLIDLRKHGGSQDADPPHTLAACAADVAELEKQVGRIDAVLGHSFGGKVALEYVFRKKDLEVAWILDSAPGARPDRRGSESTVQIVKLIGTLPERFDTREDFVAYIEKQGVERGIAMWLAMNVRQAADGKGYVMRADVPALRALLDDYFARDLWSVVEDPARTTKIHIVAGGKSSVLDLGERARAERNAAQWPDSTWLHVVPGAGHWVHVDAPNELFDLVVHYT